MLEAGMFYGTPAFDQIISDIRELETLINTTNDAEQSRKEAPSS
jgi:hypothetical protein